jgi:predicted DNA binding CopG/RHH family protein
MKNIKLSREEQAVEKALVNGEYQPLPKKKVEEIARSLMARRKDTTMTIRVSSFDIKKIKAKAKKMGIKYQTFISEVIHEVAQV